MVRHQIHCCKIIYQLSTPALKNHPFGRVVFHMFHKNYPLMSVRSSMRLCDIIPFTNIYNHSLPAAGRGLSGH